MLNSIVDGADNYDNKDNEDEEDIDYEVDDDVAEVSEASQRTLMGWRWQALGRPPAPLQRWDSERKSESEKIEGTVDKNEWESEGKNVKMKVSEQ